MKCRKGKFGLVHDGVGGIKDGVLREMAEFDAVGDGDSAGVDGQLSGENAEERGFSAAIVADEPDAFAAVDGEVQLVEHDAPAEGFFDIE